MSLEQLHRFAGQDLCVVCPEESTLVCSHRRKRFWANDADSTELPLCQPCYHDEAEYSECPSCATALLLIANQDGYLVNIKHDVFLDCLEPVSPMSLD
ncbi:hypothetical protein [Pseudoflavonifractor capillosus]|uniref:Uncharacterized protein n=1 Tax=Pseudoflavonifractor capillosus TaxID=106588 RepID=A0A921STE6_9FIRM|nr:hypothetical protein [Pseudoflavonifractor capillosus]HJG87591.1 hypothetical protein [Pseudoflavonifractor capillosus]